MGEEGEDRPTTRPHREARAGALLPPGWDAERDLFVLVGRGGEPLGEALLRAGQQRLLYVLPPGSPRESLPHGSLLAADLTEILPALLALAGEDPVQVQVKRLSDPWASQEVHRAVARAVEEALRSRRLQRRTVERQGRTWLTQGLENLACIASVPSITRLRERWIARPCVIVSPGPSLSKNVGLLAALEGRALLLAGTHVLAALERVRARPDVVLAADAGDLERHYAGIDLTRIEALLIGATCRRANFERPARRVFSFASNASLDDWIFEGLGEDARLATGGSVACSAFSLALALGADPIVLVGQDLSFPDGRYYAAETLDADARVEVGNSGSFFLRKPAGAEGPGDALADGGLRFSRDQRLVSVPGYGGGTVPSSPSFQVFLTWFEAVAARENGRVRLFNCTEGGARIRGFEESPLAEVARSFPRTETSWRGILDEACAGFEARPRAERLARHVRGMLASLGPSLDCARRARALSHAAERDPARLPDLARSENELGRAVAAVRLLGLAAQEEIVTAQAAARRARSVDENLRAARSLYDVVEEAVLFLRDPMQSALGELDLLARR